MLEKINNLLLHAKVTLRSLVSANKSVLLFCDWLVALTTKTKLGFHHIFVYIFNFFSRWNFQIFFVNYTLIFRFRYVITYFTFMADN